MSSLGRFLIQRAKVSRPSIKLQKYKAHYFYPMEVGGLKILRYSVVVYHKLPIVMSISTIEGDILTIKQVAEYLKVTDRTIYKLAAAKRIPAFKVGGTWRFSRADIDRWIAQQTSVAQTDGSANSTDSGS